MTHEESMAYLIAAVCHDYEHPGVNNVFLTQIRDKVALRHNDVSVLENHHIAATFDLMTSSPELNWLSGFSSKSY
jgi:cGMP-inhibited 3',5'-cyclic phosphodiesterase A